MTQLIEREQCPFCAGAPGAVLYSIPYADAALHSYLEGFYNDGEGVEHALLDGGSYTVVECSKCEGLYQHEIPDDGLMIRLYDHWINPEAALRRRISNPLDYYASHNAEIMQLLAMLDKPPGQVRVLDFGAGWSEWALAAKGLGCQVEVAELARSRIAHAQSNGLKVVAYEEIESADYDLINAEQVLEHVAEPLVIMRHLLSGLAPHGILKVNVPDAPNMKQRLARADWSAPKGSRWSLNPLAPLEHINLFVPKTGSVMARLSGATVRKVPLALQLQCATYWRGGSRIFRNLAMPLYRNLFDRRNYFIFERTHDGAAAQ